jgi:hypothetical protein
MHDADRPTCFGCVYFGITHDPRQPYACQAFGFRSRRLPALDVASHSGEPCRRRLARSPLVTGNGASQ